MTATPGLKTRNPAEYLNLSGKLGTVEKGKLADLLLLDANPLADIGNAKRIAAVVYGGRYMPKEAREKILADIETVGNKK
ncbi:MAG: amidohydrolase family protein [Pyrinomonadaceae bacterium]